MSLPPAAAAGRRRSSKRNASASDTIEVKQRMASITISSSGDDIEMQGEASRQLVNEASAARGKGKAPATDDFDEDDEVEEYDFSSEQDMSDEDSDDFDDAASVITLSSECSAQSEDGLSERPWKQFDIQMRRQWETMYLNVMASPIGGDINNWAITEDYQEKKDVEMHVYLEDFPLTEWVIPREEADKAYSGLLQRMRWRNMGIRIYGPRPEGIPGASRAQQPLSIPHDQYMREPQRQPFPGHQGPGPQGPPPPGHQPQQLRPNPTLPHPHGPGPNGLPMYPQGPPNNMQHMGRGHPLPPPQHALPSQPYAHPMPMHHQHHTMGRGYGPPHQPYGMAPYPMHQYRPNEPKPRRGRDRKETPVPTTPPPPPPTPPYELREKPSDKKGPVKVGRRNARRQAEADEFPWTRKLNFPEEKAKISWDDGIYDPETLVEMDAIRARNVPIIDDLDAKVQEQQRMWRLARQKKKDKEAAPDGKVDSSDAEAEGKEKKKMQRGQRKGESGGDPYHSGAFSFAGKEDEERSLKLGYKTPDDALEAGESGKLDENKLADIKICWNPGKKGTTENLEQVKFSLKDTVVTRKQLKTTHVLNRRAAECIIDFCPDMLWRGMLLRICSEAGMGNKDVRDRFCYNGCYCDKATITKRISAALGQKQVQPKSKGYGPGEYDWYDLNVKDFAKYIDYFGKRSSHRNMLKIQMQGEKRKMKQRALDAGEKSEEGNEEGPSKRAKLDDEGKDGGSDVDVDIDGDAAQESDGNESDASDDSNAVSLQDSDILDKMEDD